MGYLATEITVLLAGAAVLGLVIGWALFGLGRKKAALAPAKADAELAASVARATADLKAERDARKKSETRILELEARETNFGERLQERDTKIAELMHQLDEQARFRVQSATDVQERDAKIASLERDLAERPAAPAEPEPNPELELKDAEIARLTGELGEVKAADAQHTARVAQLERENAELRATLVTTANAAPTTSEEKDQIIARLNEEVTGLRAAYEAAEQALEEQDAAIDKLTRDLLASQKKQNQAPVEPVVRSGPTRGGAAAKVPAPPAAPVMAPPLPGALDSGESTVAVSLDALVAQIDSAPPVPGPRAATPPPVPPPVPPKAPAVEANESTVAISLDALVAQIDQGAPGRAAVSNAVPPVVPVQAPAAPEPNESTVAISLDALVAQIDSAKAPAPIPAAPVAPAPVLPAPVAPPAPTSPPAIDLSESTLAISLDALVAQIDSAPPKPSTPAPAAPVAPEPNESTVAISLDALVAQIEAGAPKIPPPPPKAAGLDVSESTVAISITELVAAVDHEGEVIALKLDVAPAPPGVSDDLQRIRGIGSNTAKRLNSAGIRTWQQMAQLSEKDLGQVADLLKISLDKIKREQWVEQARALTGS